MKKINPLKDYMTITKEEERFFIKKIAPIVNLITGADIHYRINLSTSLYANYKICNFNEEISNIQSKNICYCTGDPIVVEEKECFCPKCGRYVANNLRGKGIICAPNIIENMKTTKNNAKKTIQEIVRKEEETSNKKVNIYESYHSIFTKSRQLAQFFYAKTHPLYENGIIVHKLSCKAIVNENNEFFVNIVQNAIAEIVPDKVKKCYRISPSLSLKESDFSVMLKNKTNTVYYENNVSMMRFLLEHKKFADYTGLYHCFCEDKSNIERDEFFMSYLAIYFDCPVIELIAKMGHIHLVSDLLSNISQCGTQEMRRRWINQLLKIMNPEATNGKCALKVPKYIANDLKEKNSNWHQYAFFGDLAQLCNLTKEAYEEINNSSYVSLFNKSFPTILEVVKYGIKPVKMISYCEKQEKYFECSGYQSAKYVTVNTYHDYLYMLDMMQIQGDLFPGDLKKAHDNLAAAFKLKEDTYYSRAINDVANIAMRYIPNDKNDDLIIKIPHSVEDIVDEAQQQHNCCGSYCKRVANGETFLFFIRNKKDPETSFVTAEYKDNRINQLFYKNNMPVWNTQIIDFANDFCKILNKENFNTKINKNVI